MDTLELFPFDLQIDIFDRLSPVDLCCVSQVCATFYKHSSIDKLWKKFISRSDIKENFKYHFLQHVRFQFSEIKSMSKDSYQNIVPMWFFSLLKISPKLSHFIKEYKVGSFQNIDRHKVAFLGSYNSGKTSLLHRFAGKPFFEPHSSTIHASFQTTTLEPSSIGIIELWDISGPERYSAIAPMYYRNASASMIVFDLTCEESFKNLSTILDSLERNAPNCLKFILGNKMDLKENYKSKEIEAKIKNLNARYKFIFFFTSAKTNENIKEVLKSLGEYLLQVNSMIINQKWEGITRVVNIENFFLLPKNLEKPSTCLLQ